MTTNTQPPESETNAKRLAELFLVNAASSASESLKGLSTWSIAGGGAFIALLITQAKDLEPVIPIATVASTAKIYLGAVIMAVVAHYIATLIQAASNGLDRHLETAANFPGFDTQIFLREIALAYPPGLRWIVTNAFAKILLGNREHGGRMLLRLTIIQSLLVIIQCLALGYSLGAIFWSIPV